MTNNNIDMSENINTDTKNPKNSKEWKDLSKGEKAGAIIFMLAIIAGIGKLFGNGDDEKIQQTKDTMTLYRASVELNTSCYSPSEWRSARQAAKLGLWIKFKQTDGWSNFMRHRMSTAPQGGVYYDLWSAGPDETFNTNDDIRTNVYAKPQ